MVSPVQSEFEKADLGDSRLPQRAMLIARRWADAPAASFPQMMSDSEGEIDGFYSFVENEAVDPRELLAAHARATVERIDQDYEGKSVLVVEDTTTMAFPYAGFEREGLGWVSPQQQGFFAHVALAVAADGSRRPLGVVGMSIQMRQRPSDATRKTRNGKARAKDPTRESLRWGELADETTALLRGHAIPIHISDRESDIYEYLSGRVKNGQRFVVRAREFNRPVMSAADHYVERTKLHLVAERTVPITEREVQLSRRRKSPLPRANKKHPPREGRTARLEFGAETLRIPRPKHLGAPMLDEVTLNIVHVREIDPPADVEPVEWLLLTTEPIGSADDVLRIVDYYRARWTIEEYFKAIKTGCAYEKRQLKSAHALLLALALCVPIAWQMLLLRQQCRIEPDAPAAKVISPRRLEVLRTIAKRKPLPQHPAAIDVLLAIAALGGHLKRNGLPGWQTLRRGLDRLLLIEAAFDARDAESDRPLKEPLGRMRSAQS